MSNFVIATAARLAAENYTGKPCTVDGHSAKIGVAYEIATSGIGEGTALVARVYMDGRVEWCATGYLPCGFSSRMDRSMWQLMPLARKIAAQW